MEDSSFAFDNAREERIQRYSDLKIALERKGFATQLHAYLLGALGTFDAKNFALLNELSLPPLHIELLSRFMCSKSVSYAYMLYLSYIS